MVVIVGVAVTEEPVEADKVLDGSQKYESDPATVRVAEPVPQIGPDVDTVKLGEAITFTTNEFDAGGEGHISFTVTENV